jgi:hypothetical protein
MSAPQCSLPTIVPTHGWNTISGARALHAVIVDKIVNNKIYFSDNLIVTKHKNLLTG